MVKTKILLVEDDKSLREIYGVRLYSEGYDIISAGDGEEALALAIKERPPLIISDVMMPKISGFDMLDILRSTTETKNIKVIMMTALSSEDQRARGQALGADRYLVKSQVGIEDVVRAVHEVLGDAPVAGPSAAPAPATSTPAPTVAPSPFPQPSAAPAPLPQPTAPFSTDRPASLGDRVIHPLESNEPAKDFSALMSAELNGGVAEPATPALEQPVAPAPLDTPAVPAPLQEPDFDIPPIPASSLEVNQDTDTPPTPLAPPPAPEQPQAMPVTPEQETGATAPPVPTPDPMTIQNEQSIPEITMPPLPDMPEPTVQSETGTASGLSFEETPAAPAPGVAPVEPAPQPVATPPVVDPATPPQPLQYPAQPSPIDTGEPPLVVPPRPQ